MFLVGAWGMAKKKPAGAAWNAAGNLAYVVVGVSLRAWSLVCLSLALAAIAIYTIFRWSAATKEVL